MQHKYFPFALGLMLLSTSTMAQEFYFPTKTGQARAFIPEPKQYGNFDVLTSFDASVAHSDNIFARENNTQSDLIWVARPQIRASSDFERHALNINANAEKGIYSEFTNENYLDYGIGVNGRIDVLQSLAIPLSIGHRHDHFRRLEIEDLGGVEPTRFDQNTASAGLNYSGPIFRSSLQAKIDDFEFRNSAGINGTVINNTGLNRKETQLRAELGLARQANISPFIYTSHNNIAFDDSSSLDGLDRDGDLIEYGAGANVNFSAVTSMQFELAHATRENNDPRFGDFDTVNMSGTLEWRPLQTLTSKLDVFRGFQNTILLNSIASIDTRIESSVEYEVIPEFQLDAGLGYFQREFQDISSEIVSDVYNASLGGSYKFTPDIWLRLGYIYTDQEVNLTSPQLRNFTSNTFTLTSTFYY